MPASCRSEKPSRLARHSSSRSSASITAAAATSARTSTMRATPSTNHGSMPEALATSSTPQPSRGAALGAPAGRRDALAAAEAVAPGLQGPVGLLERLREGPADGHDLADRFHPRGQHLVGPRELLE